MAASCLRPGTTSRALRAFLFMISACLLHHAAAPPAAAAPLFGRVLDATGQPIAGARVIVDGPLGARVVETDAAGRFEIADLPDAAYRVLLDADGFAATPRTIRVASREPVTLSITAQIAPLTEAVVVSAAAVPRPRSESPVAIDVVGRQEIEARQLESVADVLRTAPGFAVSRNGGRGALTSVFPRGGESDYTLVLVDGMRVNTFGGGFDFGLLPFGAVEQVEVVRGPQSAVFGSDAVGGIVHVTTRHGGAPSASAHVEGGGQATVRATGEARGSWRNFGLGAGVEHNSSDGFTGIAPATGEQVSNDDWTSTVGQVSASWTHGAATSVRADGRWLDAERGNPGPFGSNPIGAYTNVDRLSRGADTQRQFGLQARLPWGAALAGRVEQRFQITAADLVNRFAGTFGDSFFETRRVMASALTDAVLSPTTGLTAGIEGVSERAGSTFVTGETFQPIPIERRSVGAFAELRQQLGANVGVTAGVRVDSIRRDALEGDPNPFGARPAFASDTTTSANPRLAARLVAWRDAGGTARTIVRASAGTGIRPPDAFEIAFTDNPSLQPERSRSVEAAVTHLLTPRISAEAAVFYNSYDDLIIAVGSAFQDASRYRTDNISNARARGVELSAVWRGPAGLSARGSYTFLDTEILAVDSGASAPSPFEIGDPLIRRPRHQGALDLAWDRGRVASFATLRARGGVLDIEPTMGAFGGLFEAAGFTVLDAGASVRLWRHVELFGRGINLFDRRYEEAFGFPALGRLGMVGLRVAVRP